MSNQLDRGFKIIENLAKHGLSGIDEVYNYTKIPKPTLYKILNNLEKLGYILRKNIDGQKDYWYLTLKLLKIARPILSRLDFKDEIKSILIKLSKDINEIVQLGIYHNRKVMYIDVVKNSESLISYAGIGTELDINISAAGMVIASALPREELDELLNNEIFPKNTKYTITEPDEIRKELKKIAVNGYAFDNEQYAIGIRCLAAPIFNFEGKIISAINVTGHISTMTDERIVFIKKKLLESALEASKRIGFEG